MVFGLLEWVAGGLCVLTILQNRSDRGVRGVHEPAQRASQALFRVVYTHRRVYQSPLVCGAAMVLGYDARQSTRDVDAVILSPAEARLVEIQ